jgi:multidrug transporter EmrE-like cation transporter
MMIVATPTSLVKTWSCILMVAALAVTGEVCTARAMRTIGDLDEIRAASGLMGAIKAVLTSPMFLVGSMAMALNFFALLFTLSLVDVSLAAPATASLTYMGNAVAAKFFLGENVDHRRWIAVIFVVVGVVLLAK